MDLKIDLITKKEEGRKLKKTNHCEYKLVFFHWPSKDSLISISNFNFDFHWDFSLSLSLSFRSIRWCTSVWFKSLSLFLSWMKSNKVLKYDNNTHNDTKINWEKNHSTQTKKEKKCFRKREIENKNKIYSASSKCLLLYYLIWFDLIVIFFFSLSFLFSTT
jgi:hypothetical protein